MAGKLTYLGEIFQVTEEHEDIVDAVLTKGSESGGQRIYFESADFEVHGSAILERHEILSPDAVPERLRIDNILLRHKMSKEQAKKYQEYMLKAGFNYSPAIFELDRMIRRGGVEKTFSWLEMISNEMEACDVGEDDALHSSNREEAIPATYGFHKIDNLFESTENAKEWLDMQPYIVQRLITTPRRCKTIEQLAKLGKKCYEAGHNKSLTDYQQVYLSLTNSQREVFWTEYNQKKRELMRPTDFSDNAKGLVALILKSDEHSLSKTKAKLTKIQKGQIRTRDPLSYKEWNIIWNYYKQQEYQLNNPLPELPQGYSRCGYCYQKGGVMYMPKIDLLTGKLPIYNDLGQKRLHCLSCDGY